MEVGWALASIAILADGKLLDAGITKKSDKFFRTKIARDESTIAAGSIRDSCLTKRFASRGFFHVFCMFFLRRG
jgi:hypothetical protein